MIDYMDIKEFVDLGYLQEVNRKFFHPLGLALVAERTDEGYKIAGVWDCRDDQEGIYFDGETVSYDKASYVLNQQLDRQTIRVNGLGFWIQAVENPDDGSMIH
jgi:hypothetical protein